MIVRWATDEPVHHGGKLPRSFLFGMVGPQIWTVVKVQDRVTMTLSLRAVSDFGVFIDDGELNGAH